VSSACCSEEVVKPRARLQRWWQRGGEGQGQTWARYEHAWCRGACAALSPRQYQRVRAVWVSELRCDLTVHLPLNAQCCAVLEKMQPLAARPGRLLILLLVASSFESIPAFAPSLEFRGARTTSCSGSKGLVCIFGLTQRGTTPCKTEVIIPVTQTVDPKPYGQRIYPVHPDDLSPEARRMGLIRMILAVGLRDVIMGLVLAFGIVATSSGFDSPDYHFPCAAWLFSCIFGRMVTQDDISPVAFDMRHSAPAPRVAKAPMVKRGNSFAQWRDLAVGGNVASQTPNRGPQRLLVNAASAGGPSSSAPRNLHSGLPTKRGPQRLVVKFSSAVEEEPSRWPPQVLSLPFMIVWGFISDVLGSVSWLVSPSAHYASVQEPELWDPRDESTPPESGV